MLREFGVKGVKVQEVVSLDEEMMAFLRYGHLSKRTPILSRLRPFKLMSLSRIASLFMA